MSRLRDLLDKGQPAAGIQLRFGSPAIAELAGHAGFDWVLLVGGDEPLSADAFKGAVAQLAFLKEEG